MDEDNGERIENAERIPHPEYDYSTYDIDLMLLFLEKLVAEDILVLKINSDSSDPAVNSPVTVLGWGDTAIDDSVFEMSDVLMSAEVHVQSNEDCEKSKGQVWGNKHEYKSMITENTICAEEEGVDSCQTDSRK